MTKNNDKARLTITVYEDGPLMVIDGIDIEMRITVSTARMLRSKFGLDLPNIFDDASKLYAAIYGDPVQLCEMAYAIVAPKIPSMSPDDFFDLVGGSELAQLRRAVEASILLFFDDPAKRTALDKMMQQMASAERDVIERVVAEVESLDRQEMIEAAIAGMQESEAKEANTTPSVGE